MDIRGEYGFSSLVKQNKKAEIYAVFCFVGKRKLFFYIYAVIVKQKINKRPTNHYLRTFLKVHTLPSLEYALWCRGY